jgi:hypothetical protein
LSWKEPLKIFRAQHGPNEIDEQPGGNDAAQNQIQHFLNLFAGGHVEDQQHKNRHAERNGN